MLILVYADISALLELARWRFGRSFASPSHAAKVVGTSSFRRVPAGRFGRPRSEFSPRRAAPHFEWRRTLPRLPAPRQQLSRLLGGHPGDRDLAFPARHRVRFLVRSSRPPPRAGIR